MNEDLCQECHERPGEIHLCGEGDLCEICFRRLSGMPDGVAIDFDAELHMAPEMADYIEQAHLAIDAREAES